MVDRPTFQSDRTDQLTLTNEEFAQDIKCCDLKIIGLKMNGNGGSFTCHQTCGSMAKVGDILQLKMMVITVEGRGVEDAVKCVKIFDGAETCTVAFVPQYLLSVNHFMA